MTHELNSHLYHHYGGFADKLTEGAGFRNLERLC